MATEITYNGNVIASLNAGQTATLTCAGKLAVSDIAVAFDTAGSIAYNGSEISISAGKTATLVCADRKMLSDVVVNITAAANGGRLLTADGYVLTDTNGLLITAKEDE